MMMNTIFDLVNEKFLRDLYFKRVGFINYLMFYGFLLLHSPSLEIHLPKRHLDPWFPHVIGEVSHTVPWVSVITAEEFGSYNRKFAFSS